MEPDIGIIEKNKTFETSQRALIWSILQYGKFYFSALYDKITKMSLSKKNAYEAKKYTI